MAGATACLLHILILPHEHDDTTLRAYAAQTPVCVLPPATRRGPEPGCSGRNMPRAGSGAPEAAARARGPGSTRAGTGTRKIHANPTRRRAGWRSGGRCCAGRLPLRRGKKFGAALLQTRVFAAPHKKENRPHPQQQ
jgi:hypothetical protein